MILDHDASADLLLDHIEYTPIAVGDHAAAHHDAQTLGIVVRNRRQPAMNIFQQR